MSNQGSCAMCTTERPRMLKSYSLVYFCIKWDNKPVFVGQSGKIPDIIIIQTAEAENSLWHSSWKTLRISLNWPVAAVQGEICLVVRRFSSWAELSIKLCTLLDWLAALQWRSFLLRYYRTVKKAWSFFIYPQPIKMWFMLKLLGHLVKLSVCYLLATRCVETCAWNKTIEVYLY